MSNCDPETPDKHSKDERKTKKDFNGQIWHGYDAQNKYVIHTTVSRLLAAVPVHLPMILSMHFLWMAALHSGKKILKKGSS